MAQDKKQVEQITDMEVDFAKWFTDVCRKAELIDYSSIKGMFILRPYGYAIWENFQKILDEKFKETGHENVYLPMLIPESLLQKEKDHVEGFAPECAWVTYGGSEKLEERYCIRPTSETLFCEHYANIIHSHRDLPKLYNQWCSVLRWEKTSRPFLRHREFLWQEGHTMHATAEEAMEETLRMFNIYADFCENYLAMPVVKGRKTDKEKFAGAEATYTIEAMMQDGKALQSGTSHFLGQNFTKAFDVTFLDKEGNRDYVWATSWGVSTRLVGALIMAHSDDNGLVLPPRIAPIQVVIVPIYKSEEELQRIHETADKIVSELRQHGVSAQIDDNDNKKPGWKFAEYEMKGVPVRLALGMRDLEHGTVEVARRDTLTKETMPLEGISAHIEQLLEDIQSNLYNRSLQSLKERTYICDSYDEFKERIEDGGFFLCHWDGTAETEARIKEETKATIRCIPRDIPSEPGRCMVTGRPSKCRVIIARSY